MRASPLVFVALLAACGDAGAVLEVGTELPAPLRDHVEESFEASHPGVDVRFVLGSSRDAVDALVTADPASERPFDVWWGADVTSLTEASAAGVLLPHRPVWLDEPAVVEERADESWHPILVTPFVVAFSRDDLELTRAPTDWNDLRHFRWTGDIEVLDPVRSPEGSWLFASMLQEHAAQGDLDAGFDWLAALHERVGRYVTTSEEAIRALETGGARLALLPRADVEAARADGASWLYYRLPESGTPLLASGVAIVAGTDVADHARAFVDHIGSVDVRTRAKLATRWHPAYGEVDGGRIPDGFELPHSWRPYELDVDDIVTARSGWIDRWETEIRGR